MWVECMWIDEILELHRITYGTEDIPDLSVIVTHMNLKRYWILVRDSTTLFDIMSNLKG